MEVKINKEIADYKENFFFGLPIKECIFMVIACLVAVIMYFTLIDYINTNILGLLIIIADAPIAFFGFGKYNQMNAVQLTKTYINFIETPKHLVFKSTNYYNEILWGNDKAVNTKYRTIKEKHRKKIKLMHGKTNDKTNEINIDKEATEGDYLDNIIQQDTIPNTNDTDIEIYSSVPTKTKSRYNGNDNIIDADFYVIDDKKSNRNKSKTSRALRKFFGYVLDIIIWIAVSLVVTYIVNKTNLLNIIFK